MSSQPAGTPAGVARFGLELVGRLIEKGEHDYTFRSQWPAEMLPDTIARGARLDTIPPVRNYLKEFVSGSLKVARQYAPENCDLVFNLDALGVAAGGRKRMSIIHDIYFKSMPEASSRTHRVKSQLIHSAVIGRSHAIVGISETTSSEVRRHFPGAADRVRTILSDSTMNDVPIGDVPDALRSERFFLAVANVTPNKNFGVLADAFGRMAADHPGLKLVHVGGDGSETFAHHLSEHGASDRLVRLRGIDDATLAALYANAIALVVPSLLEGFCLPILEAQRFGCPVLFSERSACGEIGGAGGISFDPTDPERLENVMRFVASDDRARETLKEKGRDNALRFSWDRTAAAYGAAISDVVNTEK